MSKSYRNVWQHRWVLCGLFFALGAIFTIISNRALKATPRMELHNPLSPADTFHRAAQVTTGLWGTLEYEKVRLQESSQVFADGAQRLKPPRWIFTNYSAARLTELLRSCEFTEAQSSFLLDTNHWEPLAGGFAISPPDEIIGGLSQASRERLYWTLADNPANYAQYLPFNFPPGGIDERFADSGLPPEKIAMIRRLVYPGYGYLWLAVDRPLLQAFTTNELESFVHVLYSYPTWLLRARVKPDSDINALVQYWGRGREKKLRPLLESLAETPGGETIDVTALLPSFAQARLDTFPDPEADPTATQQDCFYSAMNFFNDPPDARFTNTSFTLKTLQADYTVVTPPAKFGDVIVLNDPDGSSIHACVFIADDFVFTKNGYSPERPWAIMKIADVLACFPSSGRQQLVFWRRKGA